MWIQLTVRKLTWQPVVTLVSVGLLSFTGCGQSPAKAELEVKAASKGIIQIDSSILNEWFHKKNFDGVALPRGSVARVSGQIVEKNVKEVIENGSRKDSSSEVVIYLVRPEYAAVVFECRFHTTHVDEVNSFKVGSQVTAKGKLEGSSTSRGCASVVLNGCVME